MTTYYAVILADGAFLMAGAGGPALWKEKAGADSIAKMYQGAYTVRVHLDVLA